MIVYNLVCSHQHQFEGWFASAEAYEHQLSEGMVTCPVCGDHEISKLPSGPYLSKHAKPAAQLAEREVDLQELLESLRDSLESSEDVGDAFADEARRIHYMEAPRRNIRGVSTLGETVELLEEGVPVLPLGLPAKKDLH